MQDYLATKKAAIVAEYLSKGVTFRSLGLKYGIRYPTIHKWVKQFRSKPRRPMAKKAKTKQPPTDTQSGQLPNDVKQLQKELEIARLENKLLNALINIAEEQLNIDIRKKPGARQSPK